MKKILLLLLLGGAIWHYQNGGQLPFLATQGAYDEAGNPTVWLFSSDRHPEYSAIARKQLTRRKIDFQEFNVDPNDLDNKDIKFWKKHGRNIIPVTVVGSEVVLTAGTAALATALGLTFGDKYLTGTEKRLFKKHFYADGSPKIVMYGTDWCKFCKALREEFIASGIDFLEIDVEKTAQQQTILKTMEIAGYPATWVGYKRINAIKAQPIYKALQDYQARY